MTAQTELCMPCIRIQNRILTACVFPFCIWPHCAQANVGVPLFVNLALYWWLLLVPIIGIEAYLVKSRFGVSLKRAAGIAGLANVASTILGTALVLAAGLLFAVAGLSVLQGAQSDVTVLIALVPCFYLSVWFESLVASPFLKNFSRKAIWDVFFLANQVTYAMLGIVVLTRFIKSWVVNGYVVL